MLCLRPVQVAKKTRACGQGFGRDAGSGRGHARQIELGGQRMVADDQFLGFRFFEGLRNVVGLRPSPLIACGRKPAFLRGSAGVPTVGSTGGELLSR